jgi:hypothetical protein
LSSGILFIFKNNYTNKGLLKQCFAIAKSGRPYDESCVSELPKKIEKNQIKKIEESILRIHEPRLLVFQIKVEKSCFLPQFFVMCCHLVPL